MKDRLTTAMSKRLRHPFRRSVAVLVAITALFLCRGCPFSLFVAADEDEEELQQVGGTPIRAKEFRWFAAILKVVGDSFECSGFLIGRRYVVTAGHCIEDEFTHKVQVGYLCRKPDNCGRASSIVRIRKVHRHEGGGDMALLELQERVSKKIVPIIPDLGTGVVAPKKIQKKQKMTMVGSGRTGTTEAISETVEKLQVTYLPRKKCEDKLSDKSFFTEGTICSTPPENTSPCRGDSGSALVVTSSQSQGEEFAGRDVAVAVHVFGPANCSNPKKRFGGHFRISAAADLIESIVCQRGPKNAEDWCTTAIVVTNPGNDDVASLSPPLEATLERTLGFSEVLALTYNEDGSRVVTAGPPGLQVWDPVKGGAPLATISAGGRSVENFMETSPDGLTVAAGTQGRQILLIDTNSGEIVKTLKNDVDARFRAAAWNSDGTQLVSVDVNDRIKLWEMPSGEEIVLGFTPMHLSAYAIFFGPNDAHVSTIAPGEKAGKVEINEWETTGFFLLQRVSTSWLKQSFVLSVSPDKSLLATYSTDKNGKHFVAVVDTTTYDVAVVLKALSSQITSLVWSPDGRFVAGDSWRNILVWDVTTGEEVLRINGLAQPVRAIDWSPDGIHIAISASDDTVSLYELRSV